MSEFHLAQLNIARLAYEQDDPRVADFMNALDRVNAVAERSDGFVWRLKDDGGNATDIRFPGEEDASRLIVNVSVWESPEALENFVWNTVHSKIYQRRGEWFEPMKPAYFVMWWVPPGTEPTIADAAARLQHLRSHGDTDHAFGWAHLPHIQMWRNKRCA
jgi:hypothetical protein